MEFRSAKSDQQGQYWDHSLLRTPGSSLIDEALNTLMIEDVLTKSDKRTQPKIF